MNRRRPSLRSTVVALSQAFVDAMRLAVRRTSLTQLAAALDPPSHRAILLATFLGAAACGARSALLEENPMSGPASTDAGMGVVALDAGAPISPQDARSPEPTVDASLPPDAGPSAIDAAGIPAVADCLKAPSAISVAATGGYAGLSGASGMSGGEGTWNVTVSSLEFVQLDSPDARWAFAASAAVAGGPNELAPGATFTWGPGLLSLGAYAQVFVDGRGSCGEIPTGTFTVVDVAFEGNGVEPPLLRLLASFDLACGDGGRLVGCARYTR